MMLPSELLAIVGRKRFIAEIRTETAKQALGTVDALARGGIAAFEISMNIPGAAEILHHYTAASEILVGAGGVLDARGVEEAAQAGAKFVASPIMAPDVVAACQSAHVTPILGALTPTEIIAAQRAGAELVKVFPINAVGGSQYARSLFRQFAALNLLVSGGITLENLADYLALPVRAILLGSTLMPRALVERGDWPSISTIARRYGEQANAWEAALNGAPQAPTARPIMGDTTMAPAPPAAYPNVYPAPAVPSHRSDPLPRPPTVSEPPSAPSRLRPAPPPDAVPDEPAPFKPWDSKPAPGGRDDWIR
jgi:2-dehydro-3-deoxyphosphogluconate aldolase/(4S)-4-hydroxy-2-oxoglutarate aldolase